MSFEYTGGNDYQLSIRYGSRSDAVLVTVTNELAEEETAEIRTEDAPAVALAILEAAGIKVQTGRDGELEGWEYDLGSALIYLRQGIKHRAERAEREAEDAKVDEYRLHVLAYNIATPAAWDDLTLDSRENWRQKYRAARDFFQQEDEKPAPRVLQYGDPEPERGTKWQDVDGDVWGWSLVKKCWNCGSVGTPWSGINSCFFPMTEVTDRG